MKALKDISSVYFLGIGGIGMSGLARYCHENGKQVSGYDRTATELTKQLESEGISIHYEDSKALADLDADLVIYTPAIPKDHAEYNEFLCRKKRLYKRSEVLGMIAAELKSLCVAGTHGKTTTSSMLAHIMRHSGAGCNAFLGGIAANYNTNYWSSPSPYCVVEADEYDRSFLQLHPDVAIITAMDPDHLDIYGNEEKMQEAFIDFASQVKKNGLLILHKGIKRIKEFKADNLISYALNNADAFVENLVVKNGAYCFDVVLKSKRLQGFELNMGGMHNVENALAAIIAADAVGVSEENIKAAIATYKGVKRRFEYILNTESVVMIDDYAHHPEELRSLINSAKELYPERDMLLVFQPHLFSRTKDLAADFSEVLSIPDETILLPIYPARELPVEGVNSQMLVKNISTRVSIADKKDLAEIIRSKNAGLVIIAGAGDIDTLVQPVKKMLQEKYGV